MNGAMDVTAQATQAAPTAADQVDQADRAVTTETVRADRPAQEVAEATVVRQITPTGIRVGSCIRGIDVRLHWSMLLITCLTVVLAWFWGRDLMGILLTFIVYGPILYLTALVHEIGHALMTLRLGGRVTTLVLWPGGGLTITGPADGSARDDLKAALAGPLMHIPMMVFWFIIMWLCHMLNNGPIVRDDLSSPPLYLGNLSLMAFNLNAYLMLTNVCIPIYPFDCSRIVGGALVIAGVKVPTAAKVTALFGVAVGLTISVMGFVTFGIYDGLPELLIGLLIVSSSATLYSNARNGSLSNDVVFGRTCYDRTRNTVVTGDELSEGPVSESTTPGAVRSELV